MKISCLATLETALSALTISTAIAIPDPFRLAVVVEDIDPMTTTPQIILTDNEVSHGAHANPPVSRRPRPFREPDVHSKFSSSAALRWYFQYHALQVSCPTPWRILIGV